LGLVGDVVGADHHLAVGHLAQLPAVLAHNAYRAVALLGKARVVEDEDSPLGALLAQASHAEGVEFLGIPFGIGEQVLEPFGGGPRNRGSDGVAVLASKIGKEPGYVALQGLAALDAAKQRSEGLQEGGDLGQRFGRSFGYCNWYVHAQSLPPI
jgi:hypothetical protein